VVAGFEAEINDPRGQNDIAKTDVVRRQPAADSDDQEKRWLKIVDEIASRFLGFTVALLDLPEDGKTVAKPLSRIRCAQSVFAMPALMDRRIVRKDFQDRLELIVADREDAYIDYRPTHRPGLSPSALLPPVWCTGAWDSAFCGNARRPGVSLRR